ncbi:sugar ABC transporter ATP-binding protein [Microbacteriaceae bacterium VKM Ac-2855]|nr:sugar ABC transporter ATP-binding protein [Microbacteriaceae bacterium VKM Ac-2855]
MRAQQQSVTADRFVVELRGVRKSFGGVHALKGVDLAILPGTVLGIAGENGAGKSTLLKILSGIYVPDAGEVLYEGRLQQDLHPRKARIAGIAAVAQELALFEHLDVADNIIPVGAPRTAGLVNARERDRLASAALTLVGSDIPLRTLVRDLEFADRQLVEIARALVDRPKVLILDEPTSGLKDVEVERLLGLILRLRDAGTAIVFITHRMVEMFRVCDRFLVLKDGVSVAERRAAETEPDELVRLMVGRRIETLFPPRPEQTEPQQTEKGPAHLRVSNLVVAGARDAAVSFDVRPGEIVGFAGLAGQGQTEILEAVAGVRRARGSVSVGEARGPFATARKALGAGIWLVPEDRKRHGLVLDLSIAQNLVLPMLHRFATFGFVRDGALRSQVSGAMMRMEIRPHDPAIEARLLSGGNQQKIVIGKASIVDPDVYIFADPTRGIDIGTKAELYKFIRSLADEGKCILLLSTDTTEIMGLCDRVLVVASGQIVAEIPHAELSEESITAASFSGAARSAA